MRAFILSLFLLSIVVSSPVAAQIDCDEAFVAVNNKGTTVLVEPTDSDDTANIQCALDEATRLEIPTVKLQAGTFFVGGLEALDFNGSLEGNTRINTIVRPIGQGLNCADQQGRGLRTAWLKFIGGASMLRSMTIDTTSTNGLCNSGSRATYLVHFTGRTDVPDCGTDVIQSAVDRVDFVEDTLRAVLEPEVSESYRTTVSASADNFFGGCYDRLLGGFKVNRSNFTGSFGGVEVRMVGSAQVDVNFNEFDVLGTGVAVDNSNISATLLRNQFQVSETPDLFAPDSFYRGVAVSVFYPGEPEVTENRISFESNTVNFGPYEGLNPTEAFRVTVPQDRVNVNLSVRGNRFEVSEQQTDIGSPNSRRSMTLIGVNNASIAGNRVIGNGGLMAVFPSSGFGGNGNAFTGNRFNIGSPTISTWAVYFLGGATGNTVGPDQDATIWDADGGNFLSEDGNEILFQQGNN